MIARSLRSCEKLKSLHLEYRGAYGHQTCQDDNLLWWASVYKSYGPRITWSCQITWQAKTTTYRLWECLYRYQACRMVTSLDGLTPMKSHRSLTTWPCLVRRREKLKSLYLHYHNAYGDQTWQEGNLPWKVPVFKFKWAFGHEVLWDHVTNWNYYISTTATSTATKICRTVTYLDGLLSIQSNDLLITWFYKTTGKNKIVISSLSQCLWPQTLTIR